MGHAHDHLGIEHNRDFQRLWIGSSISALGSRVSVIAYPLLVLAITSSPADAGLVGFSTTMPYLLFHLPAGVLVDRWDRKRIMIACDAGRAIALGSIAVVGYAGTLRLPHLIAAAFVEGTLTVFNGLSEPVAIRQIVPAPQRLAALAKLEARGRIATLLGQPLGGFAFGLRAWAPFFIDCLSYVVSLTAVASIRQSLEPAPRTERNALGAEIAVAVRWLWRHRLLRDMTLLVAASNLVFQVLVLALLVEARRQGASSFTTGVMIAGAGLGGIVGSILAPRAQRRWSARSLTWRVHAFWALAMPLILVVHHVYALGCLLGVMACAGAMWNVAVGVYRLEVTPPDMLARVGSAMGLVVAGALPLGSLLGGIALDAWGLPTAALGLIGAMALLAGAAAHSTARGERSMT